MFSPRHQKWFKLCSRFSTKIVQFLLQPCYQLLCLSAFLSQEILRLNQNSGEREKKYFADKSLPETCALCNEAEGMLLSAALQAQKEPACGVTIEAYSPANQPRTAALPKYNRNSGSVFIFITAK